MIKVTKQQRSSIAHLFEGIEDSMVIAYLQGYMGDGYAVTLDKPKAAMIVSGEYSFFGGDAKSDEAGHLVTSLFEVNPGDESVGIFADDRPEWEATLLACSRNHPTAVPRFGIVQRDYEFDEQLLQSYIERLPQGFDLVPFDEKLYHQAMAEEWSMEFCETYASCEDYLKRGFGFAVTKDGTLVSGASAMTVYDGGIEIQVATDENFKKQGLAMICSAALVKECARRGVRPCWDAANTISKKMALSLGYEYKGEYTTIHMHR